MSADAPDPLPPTTGLTPLSSGPIPLTLPAAIAWALAIGAGTLFIALGLPALASRVAQTTVPPDAIVFGSASMIPAPGWTVASTTPTAVTLDNNGVWVTFRSVAVADETAVQRAQGLAAAMQVTYPQLTVASDPTSFSTPTGARGELIALAGNNLTAIVAAVVADTQGVDVESLGESTQFGESIADIEDMIESVRILDPGDA